MAIAVLVIGKSGSGKSTSLRNCDGFGLIRGLNKPLPFKTQLKSIYTTDYNVVKGTLANCKAKSVVIDDAGYLMTDEFMRRANEKGYDKFSDIGCNFYSLIQLPSALPDDKIVYFFMHEDENDVTGQVKPKTIGKMLDEKICIEGLFTIVLRCIDHQFYTNNSGCAKSPIGMFEGDTIDNDLSLVDKAIRDYYGLNKEEQ